jgi:hypothetical protein
MVISTGLKIVHSFLYRKCINHIYLFNFPYSYLKQTKMPFLKNREQEGKISFCLGLGTSEREEDIRKGCRRMNVVEVIYTHV